MQPKTYDNLSAAEETHWWFRHRRAVTLECLRRARIPTDGGVALDIGCGTGGNLPLLAAFSSKVVGLDLSERALSLCAAKQDDAVLVRAKPHIAEKWKVMCEASGGQVRSAEM